MQITIGNEVDVHCIVLGRVVCICLGVSPLCNYEINATSHTAVRYRVLMKNEVKIRGDILSGGKSAHLPGLGRWDDSVDSFNDMSYDCDPGELKLATGSHPGSCHSVLLLSSGRGCCSGQSTLMLLLEGALTGLNW